MSIVGNNHASPRGWWLQSHCVSDFWLETINRPNIKFTPPYTHYWIRVPFLQQPTKKNVAMNQKQ